MKQSENGAEPAILFVDDEEMARKYFVRANADNFRVLTAENVDDAKEVLREHHEHIAVLITDQRMPGEPGVVLLQYVREHYPHIVRLLTTAYSDLDDAINAVNSGEILRYIVKPWDLNLLKTELANALQYYQLQQERDQLLREKLSVLQRMSEVNRVKDLLIMAGSMGHLNRSVEAMALMLKQATVAITDSPDHDSLEMWSQLDHEVADMLQLASRVQRETQPNLVPDLDSSDAAEISELLEKLSQMHPGLTLGTRAAQAPADIAGETIVRIADRLLVSLGGDDGALLPELQLSSAMDGDVLVVNIVATEAVDCSGYKVSEELLVAFFLATHLGGNIVLGPDGRYGASLLLPTRDGQVLTPAVDNDDWLDEIFSRYE